MVVLGLELTVEPPSWPQSHSLVPHSAMYKDYRGTPLCLAQTFHYYTHLCLRVHAPKPGHTCSGIHVEIGGQPWESALSFFHLVPRASAGIVRFCGKCPYATSPGHTNSVGLHVTSK